MQTVIGIRPDFPSTSSSQDSLLCIQLIDERFQKVFSHLLSIVQIKSKPGSKDPGHTDFYSRFFYYHTFLFDPARPRPLTIFSPNPARKTSRVLFEGWAHCLRPQLAVELELPTFL
jgi:hypothetical protein